MVATSCSGTKVKCACGATGHVVPPCFEFEPTDLATSLIEWRGGRVATGRVAVELIAPRVRDCPACQRRGCAYVRAVDAR